MNRLFYSWENLAIDLKSIAAQISLSEWFPDFIVGIKRGGLIPATYLSHIMNVPLLVCSCQLRDGNRAVELIEITEEIKNKRLLFIDDICDEGDTFKKIADYLQKNKIKNYKTSAIFYNIRQNFIIDYKARKIDRSKDTSWIVFPWEI